MDLLFFLENPPPFSFQFLPDEKARLQKIDSDAEVLRLIHNYIASANTLIDHCRRIKRKLLKPNSQGRYDELINKDFLDPRSLLIVNLRNFMLHVDLPAICNRVTWTNGSSRIALLPDKLLEWEKWRADVKSYLCSLGDNGNYILLEDLFSEYTHKTHKFCKWLLKEIASCHYNDLENVYSMNQEILESVHKNGLVTDPLIVQFFTRGFRLTMGSS